MNKTLKSILSCAILLCAFACQKNTDVVRDEYIRFYSSKDLSKEINVLQIPFEGEDAKIIIKTNADVVIKFEPWTGDGLDSWITFEEPVKIAENEYEVSYSAIRLLKDLDQRTASVNVTVPKIWLGKFLKVCQGYEYLWSPASADAPKTITYEDSWTSRSITGISESSYAYLSFNAYAVCPDAINSEQTFQLKIALSDGALFSDNGLQSYVVDVAQGSDFGWSNLVYLPFKAVDSEFDANTKVSLSLLSNIEGLAMNIDNLKIYNVTDDLREEQIAENIAEEISLHQQARSANFTFDFWKIPVGAVLEHRDDPGIKCTVVDDRRLEYNGEKMYMTPFAKLISGKSYITNGPGFVARHFKYNGELLEDIEERMKNEE